ncbi:MAG: hypothetical protein ACRYF0_15640 [Janthinobacterium lividum]
MSLNYDSLPAQLLALLQAGHTITVRWDCGSDDHLVTTQLDGVEQAIDLGEDDYRWRFAAQDEYEHYLSRITNLPLLLGGFLAEQWGLPSVGDFHMQGGGQFFLEGRAIVLEFQSDATSWDDGWEPDDQLPEYYLSASELAELFPERLVEMAAWGGLARQPADHPDPRMSANYSGREVLFTLP